jgi:hypothetical protein
MTLHHLQPRQIALRFVAALLLSGVLTSAVSAWLYHSANQKATDIQRTSARQHYTNVIASLEQQWGKEAFSVKARLESLRFLESPRQRKEELIAHLSAQGRGLEFPSLQIEDSKGGLIGSFEYVGHNIPEVRFRTGQDSTWAYDPERGHLYMVFRQLIWLGSENGRLLLFKPMDNALLTEHSYPFTRLSLWWKDKQIASSEGNDGFASAAAAFGKAAVDPSVSRLKWSSTDQEDAPTLLIELVSPQLLSVAEIIVPLAIALGSFALGLFFMFGANGIESLKRLVFRKTSTAIDREK